MLGGIEILGKNEAACFLYRLQRRRAIGVEPR